MNEFKNIPEKIEFLKKYNLVSKNAQDLPVFYYFQSFDTPPIICDIIGYNGVYDNWAELTIQANERVINIHSSYLLEMKNKGTTFFKKSASVLNEENATNGYVVIDLETTGKNHKKNEIIEISAIKCVNNNIYEFSELINVNSIIPIDITLLTGITNEMLSCANSLENVFPQFLEFIGNLPLVGHNIKAFDIYFLNDACNNLGLQKINNELIDTLQLARIRLPHLDNFKLSTICDFFRIDTSNAHRALADCYMCKECFQQLSEHDSDKSFQETLLSVLKDIIIELELPKNGLIIQKNRGKKKETFSVYINEPPFPTTKEDILKINTTQSILNFEESKDVVILLVSENAFNRVSLPAHIRYEEKKLQKTMSIKVYFPKYHPELYTYIKKIIYYRIKTYLSSASLFGCCSKFIECSDAKKCVHENKLYSTACMYRMNLESGRIFYGKNRNID